MVKKFENISGDEDTNIGWKTYYVRATVDNSVFYKFGMCTGSVRKRFANERSDLKIEVLKIWHHRSATVAGKHETNLFKMFPGDRPYIRQCGPFQRGGNTETYSHDVMAGEPAPHSYLVRMYSVSDGCLHTRAYSSKNPRAPYRHLISRLPYLHLMDGPQSNYEGDFIQIAELSSPSAIVIATEEFLEEHISPSRPAVRWLSKRIAKESLIDGFRIRWWSDYNKMRFFGDGFKFDLHTYDLL